MAESDYHITLAVSAGVWTPTVRRGGTPAADGTEATIPWVENNNDGSSTTSKSVAIAFFAALRALQDTLAADGDPTDRYSIGLDNDTNGIYTPTAKVDATAASGGTALTIPHVENNNGGSSTTSTVMAVAAIAALRAILNDRAAGN